MSYDLIGYKWGDGTYGTPSGEITWSMNLVGLLVNSVQVAGALLEAFEDAVRLAFDIWDDYANLTFTEVAAGGDIGIVMWGDQYENDPTYSNFGLGTLGGTVGLAWTQFFDNFGGPDEAVGSTIFMDDAEPWSPNGDDDTLSFFAVMLHEIGHALGLDHVNDDNQIMYPFVYGDDLGPGDIAGIQFLYGATNVPSSGADTLDFSARTSGQTIDGQGGNDTITGSSFADTIKGGAGDDTVQAGAGNDTVTDALGANTVNGEAGDDLITGGSGGLTANGGAGNDIILGGSGDDVLAGGGGDDSLRGDAQGGFLHGDDRLTAGTGTDFLEGGGGADVFVFATGDDTNTIATLNIDPNDPLNTSATGADFVSGIDTVALNGFGYANGAEALTHVTEVNGHAQFSDQGTTIIFFGLTPAELDGADFIV